MALSSTVVWEIRSGGSINNGGGYKTGSTGTDYSQQNSAQYALTGVTTSGANAILLTSSASADMVGNLVKIVSGTNFTVGWYEILSVSVGVSITLDRTCASGAGSSGVVNVGGAVAEPNDIAAVLVPGNYVWMKGTFSLSTTQTFSVAGTAGLPIKIAGYNNVRGDGYQGRSGNNGSLITTNMPTITMASGTRFTSTVKFLNFECLKIVGDINNSLVGIFRSNGIKWCHIINIRSGASANCIVATDFNTNIFDNDIILTGNTGLAGINTSQASKIYANNIFISGGSAVAILAESDCVLLMNVLYGGSGNGISMSAGSSSFIGFNTIVKFSGNGIAYTNEIGADTQMAVGNMITDNIGFGINFANTGMAVINGCNYFRNNLSGNYNLGTGYYNAASFNNINAASGSPFVDYENGSINNFNLARTSSAIRGAIPYPASIGAFQYYQTMINSISNLSRISFS